MNLHIERIRTNQISSLKPFLLLKSCHHIYFIYSTRRLFLAIELSRFTAKPLFLIHPIFYRLIRFWGIIFKSFGSRSFFPNMTLTSLLPLQWAWCETKHQTLQSKISGGYQIGCDNCTFRLFYDDGDDIVFFWNSSFRRNKVTISRLISTR